MSSRHLRSNPTTNTKRIIVNFYYCLLSKPWHFTPASPLSFPSMPPLYGKAWFVALIYMPHFTQWSHEHTLLVDSLLQQWLGSTRKSLIKIISPLRCLQSFDARLLDLQYIQLICRMENACSGGGRVYVCDRETCEIGRKPHTVAIALISYIERESTTGYNVQISFHPYKDMLAM